MNYKKARILSVILFSISLGLMFLMYFIPEMWVVMLGLFIAVEGWAVYAKYCRCPKCDRILFRSPEYCPYCGADLEIALIEAEKEKRSKKLPQK